jgi:dienelactone hydrolase
MKRFSFLLMSAALIFAGALPAADADKDPLRVTEPGKVPADSRLGKPITLDGYHPMTVPANKEAWEARRKELREQVLVANGLWPMPEKLPLKPVIHGKIDRDDYTIEKVFFASLPGHYVTGNLYRPKGKTGKVPGVLCPHGHWANGRFFDAGDKGAEQQMTSGAEKTKESAHYPLQARCAGLARLGCVVFHYDMVGYADSKPITHRTGFTDADAELRLQSFLGLQTFNSIRALDFLLSLPEVDATRIAVTGASGGGTQTFLLCAVDDRPTCAFPAVMVSTGMQGGCVCENCSYLRQGAGNIDLAALFAPKPLAMSGADDWTREIETKGLPELKKVYGLYNAENLVHAKHYPFPHNYNQVSREMMYNWFNKHMKLGQKEPVEEKPFVPVPPKELSVFDEQHPVPKDAASAEELRKYMSSSSDKQIAALLPKDAESFREFQRVLGTALRVMIHDRLPPADDVEVKYEGEQGEKDGCYYRKMLIGRRGMGEQIPAVTLSAKGAPVTRTCVVWIHPAGKSSLWQDGKLVPAARQILAKAHILAPDVFLTGEFAGAKAPVVNPAYAGFTFGYNRSLLANRVHDILTAVAAMRHQKATKGLPSIERIHLVGWEKAGPWVLLARPLCENAVARTAVDCDQFRFDKVRTTNDEMMLPGAIKYGGMSAFGALCAPGELYLHNNKATGIGEWIKPAYQAAGSADHWQHNGEKAAADKVAEWLVR